MVNLFVYLMQIFEFKKMSNLIGEFECKLDNKGRFLLPAYLKKQYSAEDQSSFVINRGFEKCLVLYSQSEWNKISSKISKLNPYNKKKRDFIRYFLRGASNLYMDGSSRLLLPKTLLNYADIKKEVILFALFNKVEIWSKDIYENLITNEPDDFAALAEDVMGSKEDEELIEDDE